MTQELPGLGRALIVLGIVLVITGALLTAGPRVPWLGRLPGDFRIQRDGLSFYLPLTSCVVVSAFISLIMWVLRRVR